MAGKKKGGKTSVAASGLVSGGAGVCLALFIAVTANSVALWADWVATLLDFLAVYIAWWGLKTSEAGKTDAYNYGFGRFESLASMAMGAIMVVSFLCISWATLLRMQHPVPVEGVGVFIGIGLHVIFGGINGRLMLKSISLERTEKTPLVTTQRRIFLMKAAANALMFSALGISYFFHDYRWALYADPIAAIVIALFLLAGASKTFKFSVRDLLDRSLEEQSQLLIMRTLVHHFDQYEQIHDVRTRCTGGKVYVEIFMEFDPEKSHGAVMETIGSIKREIINAIGCDEVHIIPTAPESMEI